MLHNPIIKNSRNAQIDGEDNKIPSINNPKNNRILKSLNRQETLPCSNRKNKKIDETMVVVKNIY